MDWPFNASSHCVLSFKKAKAHNKKSENNNVSNCSAIVVSSTLLLFFFFQVLSAKLTFPLLAWLCWQASALLDSLVGCLPLLVCISSTQLLHCFSHYCATYSHTHTMTISGSAATASCLVNTHSLSPSLRCRLFGFVGQCWPNVQLFKLDTKCVRGTLLIV